MLPFETREPISVPAPPAAKPQVQETMHYVPVVVPDNVDQQAWKRAKVLCARNPQNLNALSQLERVKKLILSGDPAGDFYQ